VHRRAFTIVPSASNLFDLDVHQSVAYAPPLSSHGRGMAGRWAARPKWKRFAMKRLLLSVLLVALVAISGCCNRPMFGSSPYTGTAYTPQYYAQPGQPQIYAPPVTVPPQASVQPMVTQPMQPVIAQPTQPVQPVQYVQPMACPPSCQQTCPQYCPQVCQPCY
jgi:hypothetical protein